MTEYPHPPGKFYDNKEPVMPEYRSPTTPTPPRQSQSPIGLIHDPNWPPHDIVEAAAKVYEWMEENRVIGLHGLTVITHSTVLVR